MKKYILKLFLLITLPLFTQGQTDNNPHSFGMPIDEFIKTIAPIDSVPYFELSKQDEKIITVEMLLRYVEECYKDTLALTKIPELPNDYIIEHLHYREALTEAQLKKKGYEYQYRFLETEYVNGEYKAVGWKYYFVKVPTLAGFAEWLKKK